MNVECRMQNETSTNNKSVANTRIDDNSKIKYQKSKWTIPTQNSKLKDQNRNVKHKTENLGIAVITSIILIQSDL